MADFALQTDGSQNYIDITSLGSLGSNLGSGLYIDFLIKTTSTTYGNCGIYDGGNYFVQIQLNSDDTAGTQLNHGLAMYLSDPNGNTLVGGARTPTINFNDGNTHRLTFTVNFTAKTFIITIDGVSQTITYTSQQALANFTNFTNTFVIGARNSNGSIDKFFAATFDNFSIGTSSSNLYGKYLMDEGSGTTTADSSGNGNNGTLHKGAGSYPAWVNGLSDAPIGVASWLKDTIEQPYFIPYDINWIVWPASPATYFKASVSVKIFFSKNTIAQPVIVIEYLIPAVSLAATYFKAPPPPQGVGSWLQQTISQPYIVQTDINQYLVAPVNVSTYLSGKSPPVGSAGWLPASVYQPYFTPFNENLYDWPADVGTYAKPPPAPKGFASWGNDTISEPYFTPYDINWIVWPASPATYFKPVPPPKPEAEWLPSLIEQPYFTPYDVNNLGSPVNVSLYFKAPPPPKDVASWLQTTISQPYFTPFDPNQFVWNPNAGNLRTLVTGIPASWFTNSISQPYFIPYDINQYLNRISPELYFKAPLPPKGIGAWLIQTISQPYIMPYNELLYGIQPVDPSTYFKRPPAPIGVASWLSSVISEPYFTPYDVNWIIWPASPATYYKAPPAPPDEAGWLPNLIEQPYFPFIDINPYNTSTLPIGTYFKRPPAPSGVASWLKDAISQPYFTPYDINWIVWNPNAGNLRPLLLSYATWAARNISQPYFTPYDINNLGYPVNVSLYFKAPPAPVGIASLLANAIEQPYFPALDINLYLIKPVDVGTYFKAVPPPQGVGAWLMQSISQPYFPYIPIYLYNPPQVWAKTILFDWIKVPKSKDLWTKIPKTVTTHIE